MGNRIRMKPLRQRLTLAEQRRRKARIKRRIERAFKRAYPNVP